MGPMDLILGHTTSLTRFVEDEPQRGICMTCSSVLAGQNVTTAQRRWIRNGLHVADGSSRGHARTWPWVAARRYEAIYTWSIRVMI